MINLYDSELIKLLPNNLKSDYKVQAYCYAIDNQIKKLLDRTKKINIWSNLENVDEDLLDYLAAELRTQYYSTTLDVKTKRKLISNTLVWYLKAGTKAALEELMTTAFGQGEIKEWYEYGGEPHHFKIITENSSTVDVNAALFLNMLDSIKRKTAVLDTIEIISVGKMNLNVGVISREITREIHR